MEQKELLLTSPMCPSVNHYLGTRIIKVRGRDMVSVYEKPEAKQYKKYFGKYIQKEAKAQGWVMNTDENQYYYCDCVFYFDRKHKDTNNYFKLLLDAITESKCVWLDDTLVCERVQRVYIDSENPRIELKIHPVDFKGIFDTEERLNIFESKCKTCKRYSRNCSILAKVKESRITPEVQDEQCEKYSEKKANTRRKK